MDQIEGILNRDKKVATYKLALFRALAELALQEPRCATWLPDGRVGVPLRRLAEKWLGYYWPLFAPQSPIPQSQAEGAGGKPVKFRQALSELMAPYAHAGEHGGLAAWQLDLARGRLPPERQRALEATLRIIGQTIRDGPVQFSGGALATGTVFEFDQTQGQVLMAADLWRELSVLGHWIVDAVVLRWAQLTELFGYRQGIRSGEVLPLLLARAEPQRATGMAREVFLRHGVEHCTWSGRKLGADFAVDHVIPFSLWGSNDLWNLLPVDARVNAQKSDRLPAAGLLHDSRARVVQGWQLLRVVNSTTQPLAAMW